MQPVTNPPVNLPKGESSVPAQHPHPGIADAVPFGGMPPVKLGLWLFLASEVMFFTGLLGSYVVLRFNNPEAFHLDGQKLNWMLAAVNTLALITSSFTMVQAVSAAHEKNWPRAARNLLFTFLLGCVFLVIKAIEYSTKIEHGITPATSIFFACYFTLTGCHGLHVIGGMIPIFITWLKAGKGTTSGTAVEILGLYWHFVDLVWIFLFPLLYLL